LRELELRLEAIQLNMQETRATASPPRDDIGAPVINNRDYVKDRLMLEMAAKQRELAAAERSAREVEQRMKMGVESATAKLAAEAEATRVQGEMELLAGKLRLREEFVAGRAQAGAVEAELRLLELRKQLTLLMARLRAAQERVIVTNEQVTKGIVTRREALRAELEVAELQAELELLQFQLRRLSGGGR
jgi:hypothetical protein